MLRHLRIAAAVFFALLAIGFVGLWVRSYSTADELQTSNCRVGHIRGIILFRAHSSRSVPTYDSFEGARNLIIATAVLRHSSPFRFGFYSYLTPGGGVTISLPHWFLAGCSLALAATLGFRFPRRFTVRGMLIATTLLAATLGLAVYSLH